VIATEKNPDIRTLMAQRQRRDTDVKIPRRKPNYPMSAERELARAYLAIAQKIRKESKPFIARLMAIYGVWFDENVRTDARMSLQDGIAEILDEYGDAITDGLDMPQIWRQVDVAAKTARRASLSDWKTMVKEALDLTVDEPFYIETTDDLITKWAYESAQKIKSYPQEYLGKIQEIIEWGYRTNQPMVNVYRRIEKATGDTRSHVKMIARDQMGTLNCMMTKYEHESMGVSNYIWVTRHDNRVRECHRQLDGKMFSWDNPPAMWYMTKSRGIVYTGRYCHPGEDYCCRCRAKPVFEPSAVNAAIARGTIQR
jgi:SPP1 gp7 family putative phage head morphogenesis protein